MVATDNSSASSSGAVEPVIRVIPVGTLAANCYVVICPITKLAVVIDPGADPLRIAEIIRTEACTVQHIVHTHGHFDHYYERVLPGCQLASQAE